MWEDACNLVQLATIRTNVLWPIPEGAHAFFAIKAGHTHGFHLPIYKHKNNQKTSGIGLRHLLTFLIKTFGLKDPHSFLIPHSMFSGLPRKLIRVKSSVPKFSVYINFLLYLFKSNLYCLDYNQSFVYLT
ncbi:unnamed protein product [Cuscuta epithymum]|uniref:Uncharacterized protein n=1 Tax=Cuscuta epithymum TaxID=186058 RepID=A0AAV0FED2_9ASTE|nr:unnamed protein product [Cuscuta epithymum]CAH9133958.1 unnamed protein product [Cuscuta epithymum]